jgi:hypothetical protein
MITKEELKGRIHNIIVSVQGCKATELVTKFDLEMLEALDTFDLSTVLTELMYDQKIIEVEYELPEMDWRTKSFFLPFGTKIIVNDFVDNSNGSKKIKKVEFAKGALDAFLKKNEKE